MVALDIHNQYSNIPTFLAKYEYACIDWNENTRFDRIYIYIDIYIIYVFVFVFVFLGIDIYWNIRHTTYKYSTVVEWSGVCRHHSFSVLKFI